MLKIETAKRGGTKGHVVLTSALYYPNVGGVENSLRHLAQELRGIGYRPWILTSSGGVVDRQRHMLRCLRIDGIPVLRYRYSPIFLVRVFRAWRAARTLARRTGAKSAIARDHAGALAVAAVGLQGVYLVPGIAAVQHSPTGPNVLRWLNHQVSVLSQRLAFHLIDRLAVFSAFMRQSVVLAGGPSDIQMVRPGVDPGRFRPMTRDAAGHTRDQLGIPAGARVAVSVGRFSVHKRFDLLVRAIAQMRVDWHLVLVGDGPKEAALKDLAEEVGAAGRIHFVGRTSEPERYLGCSDVFVLSSNHETFGQVLIEAMACGLPVAAFDPANPEVNTATAEIVPDGWLFLASQLEPTDLAEAIERATRVQDERDAIAIWTREQFSWRKLALDLQQLLQESAPRRAEAPR